MRHLFILRGDGPVAFVVYPSPFSTGRVADRQPPVDQGTLVFKLYECVGGILVTGKDIVGDQIAVAVDVAPSALLLHLRVKIFVVGAEVSAVLVFGLDDPAAQIVDIAPTVGDGVQGGHAPDFVQLAANPLLAGLFRFFRGEEDVVDDEVIKEAEKILQNQDVAEKAHNAEQVAVAEVAKVEAETVPVKEEEVVSKTSQIDALIQDKKYDFTVSNFTVSKLSKFSFDFIYNKEKIKVSGNFGSLLELLRII